MQFIFAIILQTIIQNCTKGEYMQLVKIGFKSETIDIIDDLVSVNAICRNLGIDPNFQRKKIQSNESFQSEFKDIEINGIIQKVLCIPYNKVNGWLFSISVNRVKPEVKQKLIEYQKECFDVLYKHFNRFASQDTNAPYIYQLERENIELRRAINRLSLENHSEKQKNIFPETMKEQLKLILHNVEKDILARFSESLEVTSIRPTNDEIKKLQDENKHIKKTLIDIHDRYHKFVTSSQKVEVAKKELRQMTNRFQIIADTEHSGNNLNTQTIAGHSYWD